MITTDTIRKIAALTAINHQKGFNMQDRCGGKMLAGKTVCVCALCGQLDYEKNEGDVCTRPPMICPVCYHVGPRPGFFAHPVPRPFCSIACYAAQKKVGE